MTPRHVSASLRYTVNNGLKPVSLSRIPGGRIEYLNCTFAEHTVNIRNGRDAAAEFDIDRNGFVFVDHTTRVQDFYDRDEIEKVYYPEADALIRQVTGAGRVHVFDHTVRSGDAAMQEAGLREPLKQVHNDYTDRSGPQRVRDLLPGEAEQLLRRRFMIVQIWRPSAALVVSEPLAICDARSVAATDLIETERRHPNRVGETYTLSYNPAHCWYYFPKMRRDEAIVFKVYDSATDGRARFTAHSSFNDPHTPQDAPPRESIELRALVFFQ